MNQEVRSLTGLRGLSALLVMFYHYNAFRLLDGPARTFVAHGYLMVDVFFVLSGFVMAMTYGSLFSGGCSWQNFYTFLSRRVARIYPLYFLMTIPAGLLIANGWMDHWPGPPVLVSGLINLTMLQSILGVPTLNTPGWSISAEWIVYLLFPSLVALCLHGSRRSAVIVAAITVVTLPLITMAPALVDEPKRAGILDIWHYGTPYPVVRAVIEFSMGIIAFRVARVHGLARALGSEWCMMLLSCALLIAMCTKSADLLFVFLLPVFMIGIAQQQSTVAQCLSSRPIHWLGELSFAIYMIHDVMIYFIVAMARWCETKGMSSQTAMSVCTVLFACGVIALSQLAYSVIEKPARRTMRALLSGVGSEVGIGATTTRS
ncbi:acyltransferase [Paraburkholderia azotifigens]